MAKAEHPSVAFELDVIKNAVKFTAFCQIDRMKKEKSEHATYAQASEAAVDYVLKHKRPGLVYAINAQGRQALVTHKLAQRAGLV